MNDLELEIIQLKERLEYEFFQKEFFKRKYEELQLKLFLSNFTPKEQQEILKEIN